MVICLYTLKVKLIQYKYLYMHLSVKGKQYSLPNSLFSQFYGILTNEHIDLELEILGASFVDLG